MATPLLPEQVQTQDAVLLYDGLCGFCDGTVRWLLRRSHAKDHAGRIYFLAQQTELAQAIFARYGISKRTEEDRAYLLVHPGTEQEQMLQRSDAIVHAVALLGGGWRLVAAALGAFPRGFRNAAYGLIARNRYWIGGRRTECRIPTAEERSRFLGL